MNTDSILFTNGKRQDLELPVSSSFSNVGNLQHTYANRVSNAEASRFLNYSGVRDAEPFIDKRNFNAAKANSGEKIEITKCSDIESVSVSTLTQMASELARAQKEISQLNEKHHDYVLMSKNVQEKWKIAIEERDEILKLQEKEIEKYCLYLFIILMRLRLECGMNENAKMKQANEALKKMLDAERVKHKSEIDQLLEKVCNQFFFAFV